MEAEEFWFVIGGGGGVWWRRRRFIKSSLPPPAGLPAIRQPMREPCLPIHNLGPCALIQKIVTPHHGLYGVFGGVGVAFAEEGVVHLLRGGIFPVLGDVAAGDGGGFARCGEGGALVGGGGRLGDLGGHVVEGVEGGDVGG